MSTPPNFIQANQIQQLRRNSDNIRDFLGDIPMPKGRISELAFVEYFLPLFTGKIPPQEHDERLGRWYRISGGPYKAVDIVKPDGSVLEFPMFFDLSTISVRRVERRDSFSLESLSHQASLAVGKAPAQAAQAVTDLVDATLAAIGTTEQIEVPENVKQIHAILKSYDPSFTPNAGAVSAQVAPPPVQASFTDDEY